MAQKDVINTCLRVFCVVLAVAAIGQSSCIDDKRAILNNTEGPPLVGGWMKVENPQDDDIVKGIAASGLKAHNQQSNDMHQFGLFNDGDLEAYQQVRFYRRCRQVRSIKVGYFRGTWTFLFNYTITVLELRLSIIIIDVWQRLR